VKAGTSTSFARLREWVQREMRTRMPEHVRRLALSADEVCDRQQAGLRTTLAHAIEHSPFHARRLAGLEVRGFELADLAELPVMTKSEMMDEFDEVVADRRLCRHLVAEALAVTGCEPSVLPGEHVGLASGRSSGQRGLFVLDTHAMVEFFCSLQRSAISRLAALGGQPPGGLTIAMVAAASAVHATGLAPAITAGSALAFVGVPVTLPLAEIVERLNDLQPRLLYGYPSMLARLAAERRAGRLGVSPASITTTGETLLPEYRAAIADGFAVPIVNTFGSSEGLVGVSKPDAEVLTFNTDMCIVEVVDHSNRPVPPGTPSAKVLLTNLYNRAQPLIRYELTDRFVPYPAAASHGHLRATVEGRADEILSFQAVEIHPFVIRHALVNVPEVIEYQVRQTACGIDVAVVAAHDLDLEDVTLRLRSVLAGAGLTGAEVSVHAVPHLARYGDTGKIRRFIPL
jgi:phenylacetate-CoA ligase